MHSGRRVKDDQQHVQEQHPGLLNTLNTVEMGPDLDTQLETHLSNEKGTTVCLLTYSSTPLAAAGRRGCGRLPMSSKCNDESLFSPEDFLTSSSSAVFLSRFSSRLEDRFPLSSCSISLMRFNESSVEQRPHG